MIDEKRIDENNVPSFLLEQKSPEQIDDCLKNLAPEQTLGLYETKERDLPIATRIITDKETDEPIIDEKTGKPKTEKYSPFLALYRPKTNDFKIGVNPLEEEGLYQPQGFNIYAGGFRKFRKDLGDIISSYTPSAPGFEKHMTTVKKGLR